MLWDIRLGPIFVVENDVNRLKALLGVSAAALVCMSGAAHAAHVAVFVGGGYYYPWVPPVYYAPPAVVAVPVPAPEPQQYVQQGQPQGDAAPQQSSGTWYFCDASRTYYPYVKQCSSGWRPVPAQPAGQDN